MAIASQGSFGELSERHLTAAEQLRSTFFPEVADDDVKPRIDIL